MADCADVRGTMRLLPFSPTYTSVQSMRVRSCVVSRSRYPLERLVRLTLDDNGCLVVAQRSGGGRSAWVRPEADLLRKLEAKPGMARRSLRRTPRSGVGLLDAVSHHLANQVAGSLRRAWRSGRVRLPRPSDPDHLPQLVSWQSSETSSPGAMLPWDAAGVGCLLGRSRIHALVALPSRPTRALLLDLRRWHELGYSPAPLADPSSL